ncbi:hypothetical protein JCM8097_004749 [Rhodosporidiobolus ruineniae]
MLVPTRPPGLPVVAHLVLSSPPLLQQVLYCLVQDGLFKAQEHPADRPSYYRNLCALSLVSKTWAEQARSLLHQHLWFGKGDEQLKQWVYAVDQHAQDGKTHLTSQSVIVLEREEVNFDEEEGSKWSLNALRTMFSRLHGVQILQLGLVKAGGVPGLLLEGDGFKDLDHLTLACPLAGDFTLSSVLRILVLVSVVPDRPWFTCLTQLEPSLQTLAHLSLAEFCLEPFEPLLFPSLAPSAAALKQLDLPCLHVRPSSWRLALFALLCRSLKYLHIKHGASPEAIRELLPLFFEGSSALETVAIDGLCVPLGAGLVASEVLPVSDPIEELVYVLDRIADDGHSTLKHLHLHDVHAKGGSREYAVKAIKDICLDIGVECSISLVQGEQWEKLSERETSLVNSLEAKHAAFMRWADEHFAGRVPAMQDELKLRKVGMPGCFPFSLEEVEQ